MLIKQNHMHVDQHGLCYLPYLHEWNRKTSNIIGAVQALAEVFQKDPFIYSKPPQPQQPAERQQPATQSSAAHPTVYPQHGSLGAAAAVSHIPQPAYQPPGRAIPPAPRPAGAAAGGDNGLGEAIGADEMAKQVRGLVSPFFRAGTTHCIASDARV